MSALRGIKIADFSRVLAGPYATMLLADMGATVIKIERPIIGDDTRSWGPPFNEDGKATYFESVNRNKLGVTADLTTVAGQEKAMEIISESDVIVENFAFGTMEKFGLGYDQLKDQFPHLIYCSISGFGTSEKGRVLPGYDLLVQAMSGLMSITGPDADSPTKVGVALVDVIAGLHTALGIASALVHRGEAGEGQKVEINLLSSALSAMVNQSGAFAGSGVVAKAMGNEHPSIAPYEVYKTLDRRIVIAVGNDAQFAKLCGVLDVGLAGDLRFSRNTARVAHRVEMNLVLSAVLKKKSADHWISALMQVGVPAGPINTIEEAVELAQRLELNPIISIKDYRDGSQSKTIANPIKFSATPVEYPLGPPGLGVND